VKHRRRALLRLLAALSLSASCDRSSSVSTPAPADIAPAPAPADEATPGHVIKIGQSTIHIVFEGHHPADPRRFLRWVERSATIVADYLGAFPVPDLEVTLSFNQRARVGFGQHWDGRWVQVRVGAEITDAALDDDWVMVHEMLHAGFPDLEKRHKWMQEGLSTYLEPIARARAGNISRERVWSRWLGSMPHGVPRPKDRGLDLTRSWGSLYWGGAIFWLLADIEIRTRTDNTKSLRDALQGILAAGGNGRAEWSTATIVARGDAATGTTVLADLYERMAARRGDVDLEDLWERLGVREADESITFDSAATLAHVCAAITAPDQPS
jgi:hypothetical protein